MCSDVYAVHYVSVRCTLTSRFSYSTATSLTFHSTTNVFFTSVRVRTFLGLLSGRSGGVVHSLDVTELGLLTPTSFTAFTRKEYVPQGERTTKARRDPGHTHDLKLVTDLASLEIIIVEVMLGNTPRVPHSY